MERCEHCNKEHDGNYASGRFCTNRCARAFSTKAKREEINKKVSGKLTIHGKYTIKDFSKRVCLYCGNKIERRRHKYCSACCQHSYQYLLYINKWLLCLGNTTINKRGLISRHIRRYLFELNDNKCQKCGWSKINLVTGNIPLDIHHIDGNSTNCNFNNLELLCPNCHSLTGNYGNLNKGNSSRGYGLI